MNSSYRDCRLSPARWFSRAQLAYWGSFIISALVMLRIILQSIGSSERFSQAFDNTFHLNAVRYIVEKNNGSSLFLGGMTAGDAGPTFYPAAWHDVVSLVFVTAGHGSIPISTNAMIIVVATIVWPLSILYLMRSIMRFNYPSILSAGAIISGFTAFPVLPLFFGVLYPNCLGFALVPAGLGLTVNLLRISQIRRVNTVQAVLLGIIVMLGIGFAHPNSAMSLLLMAVPVLVIRGIMQVWKAATRRATPGITLVQVLVIAAFLCTIWELWGIVRPDPDAASWDPAISESQAFGEVLLHSPLSLTSPQWAVAFLTLLGVVAVLYTRRNLWIVLVYGVLVYCYVCARWLPWDQGRMWTTGVWYNDPHRLAGLVPTAAVPLAIMGVHWATETALKHPALERWKERVPQLLTIASIVTVILALALTQFSGSSQFGV